MKSLGDHVSPVGSQLCKEMVDELLIEKVKEYECLYNTIHKHYRDSNVRQRSWDEIGHALQMPGTVAKTNWDKLRRCFTNARNRHRGSVGKRRIVWKYEEKMAFLLPFLDSRKMRFNLNEIKNESDDNVKDSFFETSLQDSEGVDEDAVEEHEIKPLLTKTADDENFEIPEESKPKESQNPTEHHCDFLNETSRQKRNEEKCQFQSSKFLDGFDDMDVFFLSMSKITKKLPKLEQSRIKLELSNLVLTAEMQTLIKSND